MKKKLIPNIDKLVELSEAMLIVLLGYIELAIYKLNYNITFPNIDELLWYVRSKVFWDKMVDFDFSGLIQSAQPGITVYWFAGFLMEPIPKDSYVFSLIENIMNAFSEKNIDYNNFVNLNNANTYALYQNTSFLFNAPLFLLMTIFYIFFYFLLRKLGFNKKIAIMSLVFLTTNIYLTYWTTPADKMLVIFSMLSLLTFLVHADQKKTKKYLILSATFGAFAVLSKISAFFIIPFLFIANVYYALPINASKMKEILNDWIVWILVFVIVCIIFLPTIIVFPQEAYALVFKPRTVYETGYSAASYIERASVFADTFRIFASSSILRSLVYSLVFSAAILTISATSKKYRKVYDFTPKKHFKIIAAYVIFFILMVTVISKNHDIRQMSPAIAAMSVIAAVLLNNAVHAINKKLNCRNGHVMAMIVILAISVQFVSVLLGGISDFKSMISFYF